MYMLETYGSAFFRALVLGESKKKIASIVRYGKTEKDAHLKKKEKKMGLHEFHHPIHSLSSR